MTAFPLELHKMVDDISSLWYVLYVSEPLGSIRAASCALTPHNLFSPRNHANAIARQRFVMRQALRRLRQWEASNGNVTI